eukprot:7082861-Prorocentrum_lima.AAC.1
MHQETLPGKQVQEEGFARTQLWKREPTRATGMALPQGRQKHSTVQKRIEESTDGSWLSAVVGTE